MLRHLGLKTDLIRKALEPRRALVFPDGAANGTFGMGHARSIQA